MLVASYASDSLWAYRYSVESLTENGRVYDTGRRQSVTQHNTSYIVGTAAAARRRR